jgi:hypothetical protein
MSSDEADRIATSLRRVLNTHGHGFHYAVVRQAEILFKSDRAVWILDAAEFPVIGGGQVTHIDFILRTRSTNTVLVGECKRADPARAWWCFARSPYTWRNSSSGEVAFDQLSYGRGKTVIQKPRFAQTQRDIFHLGFELKTNDKGDGAWQSSSAINTAVTQVLRGTSGLIDHFHNTIRQIDHASFESNFENKAVAFVPAVFTTAQIWTTDTDISSADLKTGDFPQAAINAKPASWIWFTHNRSPTLKPQHGGESTDVKIGDLSVDLRQQFARSVAIVSATAIEEFFCADLDEWLW